jgi:hypothetical protein
VQPAKEYEFTERLSRFTAEVKRRIARNNRSASTTAAPPYGVSSLTRCMIWLADIIGASGRFRSVRAKFMNDAKTKLTHALSPSTYSAFE